jgi:hypothetical protein
MKTTEMYMHVPDVPHSYRLTDYFYVDPKSDEIFNYNQNIFAEDRLGNKVVLFPSFDIFNLAKLEDRKNIPKWLFSNVADTVESSRVTEFLKVNNLDLTRIGGYKTKILLHGEETHVFQKSKIRDKKYVKVLGGKRDNDFTTVVIGINSLYLDKDYSTTMEINHLDFMVMLSKIHRNKIHEIKPLVCLRYDRDILLRYDTIIDPKTLKIKTVVSEIKGE